MNITSPTPQAITPLEKISVADIKGTIRSIPDFPKPGILFRDIMPVLKDPNLFNQVTDYFYHQLKNKNVQYIVGIESRGFILGAPLAQKLGAGFIPVRKAGKLPGDIQSHQYELEYGTDTIEMQADAIEDGARVVLIDDLLATGGTAGAACQLLTKLGAKLVSILFMIELEGLKGKEKLPADVPMHSMIQY